MRVYRPVLQILTIFQTKQCHNLYPFSDLGLGLFLESPGNFLGPESWVVFAAFTFKLKVSIILKSNKMKLSVNEAKLTDLWARSCATIQQVWILKFAFDRSETFSGLSRNRGVSWCCGNYCWLAFVLWCGYCSVSFQSFVLRHWCPQHQETTRNRPLNLKKLCHHYVD